MIDRTTFDLRIAEHSTATARVNQSEWRHSQPDRRPIRTALASALVALATRLAPANPAPVPHSQSSREQPTIA